MAATSENLYRYIKKGTEQSVWQGTDKIYIGSPKSSFGEYANAAVIVLGDEHMRFTKERLIELRKILDEFIAKKNGSVQS